MTPQQAFGLYYKGDKNASIAIDQHDFFDNPTCIYLGKPAPYSGGFQPLLRPSHAVNPLPQLSQRTNPGGKTYCCGVGKAPACSGPDWSPISFDFKDDASAVSVGITIDGAANICKGESVHVSGDTVNFPNLPKNGDCLGDTIRSTGALTGDLQVSYDADKDVVVVEVDSEGVDETLGVC